MLLMKIFGSALGSSPHPPNRTGVGLATLLTSIAVLFTKSFAGLFLAAHYLKIEWIVIKGVSNFADGRKSKSWNEFASVMAASLTAHILSNPIVFENWPHKGEYAATCIVVSSPVRAIRVSGEGLEPNSPDNDWKRGSVASVTLLKVRWP